MQDKVYVVEEEEINIEKLEETINQIHESNDKLNNSNLPTYNNKINSLIKNYKRFNNKYKRKIVSIFLAITASISLFKTIHEESKSAIDYNGIKYIYDGKDTKQEEVICDYDDEDETNIIVYGEWNKEGKQRINKIYDVSEYTFEDIKDYFNIDLSNLEYIEETQLFSEIKNASESNNENEKDVITTIIDKSNPIKVMYYFSLSFLSFISFLAIELISLVILRVKISDSKDKEYYKTIYLSNMDITLYIFNSKLEKLTKAKSIEELNEYYEEIKEPLNEILNEIEKNNELRNEFVRLFNENKYLLNDPNLLMEKYNETLKEYDLLKDKEMINKVTMKLNKIKSINKNN